MNKYTVPSVIVLGLIITSTSRSAYYAATSMISRNDYVNTQGLQLHLDASRANGGTQPRATGCVTGNRNWDSFGANTTSFSLGSGFVDPCSTNGWLGTGSTASPYQMVWTGASGEAVDLGDILNPSTSDFTWEVWMKSSTNNGKYLLSKGNDCGGSSAYYIAVRLNQGNPGRVLFTYQDGGTSSSNTVTSAVGVNNSSWHHVTAIREGTTATVYVDGVSSGSNTQASLSDVQSTSSFLVGNGGCTGNNFTGSLAVVRIYSRALTASEVLRNCKNQQWRFGGGIC